MGGVHHSVKDPAGKKIFDTPVGLFLVIFKARASAPLSSNYSFDSVFQNQCPDVRISLCNHLNNFLDYSQVDLERLIQFLIRFETLFILLMLAL